MSNKDNVKQRQHLTKKPSNEENLKGSINVDLEYQTNEDGIKYDGCSKYGTVGSTTQGS